MNLFILHMILLLGAILGFAVAFLSGGGRSRVYISSGDGTGKGRVVRRSAPIPVENMLFLLIALGCIVTLYLTHFNLCTFLSYWVPGINLFAIQGLCGF